MSIALVASAAAALFFAIAASFSACVRFGFALIASSLALRAVSTSAFAASFLATTGLSAQIAVVPDSLAVSRVVFVVASLIAVKAAVLSAFTLAIAAAFSSSVAFGVALMAAIFSVAAVFTASIAGCLSSLVKSVNGLTSLEPSLYVATMLLPSLVIVATLLSVLSTASPRLDSRFLSSLVLEYSNFALILANSSSVTAVGSATATLSASVGVTISYFLACAFNTNVTAPGSVRYVPTTSPLFLFFTALLAISAPSVSVAVAKRVTSSNESFSVFGSLSCAIPETCPVTLIFAGVAVSELIAVTVNPHSLSCRSGFPPTLFKAIFPPFLRAADLIFPESSLNVISTSASSPV